MGMKRRAVVRWLSLVLVALGPVALGPVMAFAEEQAPAAPAGPAGAAAGAAPAAAPEARSRSGLPLPRFVSLKADRVNLRVGPGTEYPTSWVYRRAGLPLEVTKEFEGWREVRDADGSSGWLVQTFLSGRRTALVTPWDVKPGTRAPQIPIRYSDSEKSRSVALVEAGVIANIHNCDGKWCSISVDRFSGYLRQNLLWGVYENEIVK